MEDFFRWGARTSVLYFALVGSPLFALTGVYAFVTHKDLLYWVGMTVPPYLLVVFGVPLAVTQVSRAPKGKVGQAKELLWLLGILLYAGILDWVTGFHLGSDWLILCALALLVALAVSYLEMRVFIKRQFRKAGRSQDAPNPPNE